MWLMQNALAKPDNAGAGATDYMHLFGLVALGYMWCRMVEAAKAKLAAGGRRRAHEREARHRPLLHGAHAAGDGDASRAHPGGRGEHDGAAGGGVLRPRSRRCAVIAPETMELEYLISRPRVDRKRARIC